MTTRQTILIPAAADNGAWHLHAYPVKERVKSAPRWPDVSVVEEFEVTIGHEIDLDFDMPAPDCPPNALLDGYWRAEVFGWTEPLSWVLVLDQLEFHGDTMQAKARSMDGNRRMPESLELRSRHPDNRALVLRLTPLQVTPDGVIGDPSRLSEERTEDGEEIPVPNL